MTEPSLPCAMRKKTAVSHRRMVCVVFTASSLTLTIDTAKAGVCSAALNLPGSNHKRAEQR